MRLLWHRWRLQYLKVLLTGANYPNLRDEILDKIQHHCDVLNKLRGL